jgi:uncharacterized membrane protein (UPF0127 family)
MRTHTLTSPLQQARGVIGRYPAPDERYVFQFDSVKPRTVHMFGVRRPLDVTFCVDGQPTHETMLRPWLGWARARCDTIVERRP